MRARYPAAQQGYRTGCAGAPGPHAAV